MARVNLTCSRIAVAHRGPLVFIRLTHPGKSPSKLFQGRNVPPPHLLTPGFLHYGEIIRSCESDATGLRTSASNLGSSSERCGFVNECV